MTKRSVALISLAVVMVVLAIAMNPFRDSIVELATPTPSPVPLLSLPRTPRPTQEPLVNSLSVKDQKPRSGDTIVVKVSILVSGWVVIRADSGGKPGAVLGYTKIGRGRYSTLAVKISDPSKITPTLWASLHFDAGRIRTFEYPGPDYISKDRTGKPIQLSFKVLK